MSTNLESAPMLHIIYSCIVMQSMVSSTQNIQIIDLYKTGREISFTFENTDYLLTDDSSGNQVLINKNSPLHSVLLTPQQDLLISCVKDLSFSSKKSLKLIRKHFIALELAQIELQQERDGALFMDETLKLLIELQNKLKELENSFKEYDELIKKLTH